MPVSELVDWLVGQLVKGSVGRLVGHIMLYGVYRRFYISASVRPHATWARIPPLRPQSKSQSFYPSLEPKIPHLKFHPDDLNPRTPIHSHRSYTSLKSRIIDNRVPKVWSAIPIALLCLIVNWCERKQGSGSKRDEFLWNTGGLLFVLLEKVD